MCEARAHDVEDPVRRSTTPTTDQATSPMTQTRTRTAGAVLLALLCTLVLAPTAAQAQASLTAEELGVDVAVGYGGHAVRSRWVPVSVTLAPTRLFAGDIGIVAQTNTGRVVESREVEVAAGSTKVYRFLVPPTQDLSVQLAETGEDEGLTVRPRLEFSDTFLVGVLGDELPRGLPPLTSYPLDQRGTFVPVPLGFLERSSRALDPLSALVVTPTDLASLDDATRARITTAVASGTDLLVPAAADGDLDLGLPWTAAESATTAQVSGPEGAPQAARLLEPGPTAWGLTPADLGWGDDTRPVVTATNAGRGRLLVSGIGLGEGVAGSSGAFWSRVLQPNRPVASNVQGDGLDRIAETAGEGLRSDSVDLPGMPLMIGFLLAYLLLVGPVNGVVLARLGRRELAWVTIPALTVVFAAGAFVAAAGTESASGLSGRAAYWIDGQGAQIQTAAVRAPRVGDHDVRFPGGDWDLAPVTWSPAPAVVDRSDGDTVLRMRLEALQVGTVAALRDVDAAPPLGIDVDPVPGGARVTVTNRSTTAIDDVQVRAGTVVQRVGALAAGETRTVDLTRDTLPVVQNWGDAFAGLRGPDGRVVAPASLEALLRWSVVDGNPGIVWATGTVDGDLGLGVPEADGAPTDDQGSFLAVGVTAGSPGSDTLPWEVDRQLLTVGFGEGWRPGPLAIEGRVEAVLRFRLPNEGPGGALVPSLDRGQLRGAFDGGIREMPPMLEVEPPPCPDGAVSCSWDGQTFEACFPDGSCEASVQAQPVPPVPEPEILPDVGGAVGLEVWDHALDRWVGVDEAFAGTGGGSSLLGPLGQVFVRATGELQPFDFSGRGIAVMRGEA